MTHTTDKELAMLQTMRQAYFDQGDDAAAWLVGALIERRIGCSYSMAVQSVAYAGKWWRNR